MGIFSSKRTTRKVEEAVESYFQLLQPYSTAFRTFEGSIYEMELTRAAIHSFATRCSKLKPEVIGPNQNNKALEKQLQFAPNPLQDTKKYLYRLATIYMVANNAFICPLYDDTLSHIKGFYPLHPDKCQLVRYGNQLYINYEIVQGQPSCIEFERIGRMSQFQNKNELFGDSNQAFRPTMEMLNAQNQAIVEGAKNSGVPRFMATFSKVLKDKDREEARREFITNNLGADNSGGVMILDSKYKDVKQITNSSLLVDDKQMKMIRENVFYYFGTNEKIITNSANADEEEVYYEGKIEPFALEASLVHSLMTFSKNERSYGNQIMFTSNRLQYLSNTQKISTITQLFDRGFLTHNQGLEILNLPNIGPEGDKRYVRKEYALSNSQSFEGGNENANQAGGETVPLDEPVEPITKPNESKED